MTPPLPGIFPKLIQIWEMHEIFTNTNSYAMGVTPPYRMVSLTINYPFSFLFLTTSLVVGCEKGLYPFLF